MVRGLRRDAGRLQGRPRCQCRGGRPTPGDRALSVVVACRLLAIRRSDDGVRRHQGLEPRTVALKEAKRPVPGPAAIGSARCDLGVCLPLLSAGDQGLPIVRGPSAAHGGHGGRARRGSEPVGDAPQLDLRVRPVQGNWLPRWQAANGGAAAGVNCSVSEILGGPRRPAAPAHPWLVSRVDGEPVVTGVIRCDPVVRGPDVTPVWPQWLRARKAVSGRGPHVLDGPPWPRRRPDRGQPPGVYRWLIEYGAPGAPQ